MTERDLKTALRAAMAQEQAEAEGLSPDELLKLKTGELSDEERDGLLERASSSTEASRALLDAWRFPEVKPVDEQERVTDSDLARLWRGFQDRVGEEGARDPEAPRTRQDRPVLPVWSFFNSLRFAQAAATVLLLVCAGLSWSLLVRTKPDRPGLNLSIVELVPEMEAAHRNEATAIRISATADGVLLVLTLRDRRSYSAYEVTIEDSAGASRWGSTSILRASEGFFTLELPRGFLPAGRYRIVLDGMADGQQERLAVYRLTIEG